MKCPRCGFVNLETANFCSRCGLQLVRTTGQRRPVAVIFADISGFTALSEKLDPEEVKDLIDDCLQRLARIIQNYEGYVDKFIGDCIMALFGAPVAHEDDPLRAVLAGLDLLAEIKKFNNERQQKLSLSIGINYGLVATGDLGRPGGYTVMGDVVNLAQRLQRAAPRGKLYVSEEVYKNTSREIIYQGLGKIAVKGKREKVLVFTPVKAKSKYGQRKILEIPMIGRITELNHLNKVLKDVIAGKGRIVAIAGEAGIGKTKLVYEFKKQLTENVFIAEGKGVEYHSNSPYFVLKEILKEVFSIAEADTPQEISHRIMEFLEKLNDPLIKIKSSYYKYFLSADLTKSERNHFDSMQVEDRHRLLLEAIHSLFTKLARTKVLVMIFDDCHWIDKETMDFVRSFTGTIGYKPIMVITLYRPYFNIGSIKRHPYFSMLELKPLAVNETTALLKTVLHCDRIANDLLKLLLEKSGSIPFYVSELAISLATNSNIYIRDGVALIKEKASFVVPRSLDELVMTRVDKLTPELRYIVNIAAVIGEQFSIKLLNALIPGKERLRKNLARIVQYNILKIIADKSTSDEEKFGFAHSIIRDAVYNSLLKKEQREYHQKVGYVMERIFNLTIEEYFDALAHHFYLGGEKTKAIEYMEKAGDQKKELYLNDAAITMYKKCLEMIPESMIQASARIYEKLGNIYELIGDYNNALNSYISIEKYAGSNVIMIARSLREQANVVKNQGNYDQALDLLSKAKERLNLIDERTSKPVLMELSNITSSECWLYRIKGKMEIAEKKGLEAINIVKGIKDWQSDNDLRLTLSKACNNLSVVYCVKGDFNRALDLSGEALTIAEEIGYLKTKVDAYNVMGTVFKAQGDYERAIDSFTMNLKITEELGDKKGMGVAYCNLGNVYQHKGEHETALDLYKKFLEISQELNDKSSIGMASNNMGIIYFNIGDYEKALDSFRNYLKTSKELGDKRGEAIACGNMGEVMMNQFEYHKAKMLFAKYLKISQEIGDKRSIGSASYNLGQVHIEMNKLNQAKKFLSKAQNIFESMSNKIGIGFVTCSIAYLNILQGKTDYAIKLLETSLDLSESTHADELKVQCLFNLGRAYSQTDKASARKNFYEAIRICQKNNYHKILADIYYEYGKFLKSTHQKQEGEKYLNEARKTYHTLKIRRPKE